MINKKQFELLTKTTPANRKAYFATDFFAWWFYYFHEDFVTPLAKFHLDWIETLEKTDLNILIKWFRGSIKTTIIVKYIVWVICYKKYNFIVWQSFGSDSSQRMTKQIALDLMNAKLEADYGILFSVNGSREDMEKKSIGDFDTKNGVKVLSASLGEKLRGAISRNSRPDLLILDDIDVTDSVRNPDIIQKNYDKITGETIGAMSKDKSRIIFLGNVINDDWVVPRFENEKSQDKNWKIFVQPLYNEDGSIAWDFFTSEKIEKIRSNEWEIAFSQNYLLVPYVGGETIIKREQIHWISEIPKLTAVTIGIDPASSTRNFSDSFAIVVCWHLWMRKIILETIELKGQDKWTENMLQKLRETYNKWNASQVNIEFVSLQREFCEYLYNLLKNHNFAVRKIVPTKDKVARLMEYEWNFSRWDVEFVENIGNKNLVSQLLKFPNVEHDDLVDAMVYWFEWRKPAKFGIVETRVNEY